ncbi:GFA family protein [Polaromonas eurypsychrophila]|uniref:hypothetical protein n=1 Tax=Polaromonas eurypsychrophila TaxID=1614635 RepID=UPI004032C657
MSASTYRCNCSICARNRFWPAIAAAEDFRLLSGQADLTKYLFNTLRNEHHFATTAACALSAWAQHPTATPSMA